MIFRASRTGYSLCRYVELRGKRCGIAVDQGRLNDERKQVAKNQERQAAARGEPEEAESRGEKGGGVPPPLILGISTESLYLPYLKYFESF